MITKKKYIIGKELLQLESKDMIKSEFDGARLFQVIFSNVILESFSLKLQSSCKFRWYCVYWSFSGHLQKHSFFIYTYFVRVLLNQFKHSRGLEEGLLGLMVQRDLVQKIW